MRLYPPTSSCWTTNNKYCTHNCLCRFPTQQTVPSQCSDFIVLLPSFPFRRVAFRRHGASVHYWGVLPMCFRTASLHRFVRLSLSVCKRIDHPILAVQRAVSFAGGGRSSSPTANKMRSCWRRSHKTRTRPRQPATPQSRSCPEPVCWRSPSSCLSQIQPAEVTVQFVCFVLFSSFCPPPHYGGWFHRLKRSTAILCFGELQPHIKLYPLY